MNYSDENQKNFNEILHRFFGQNPANPYWALIALYLRKNHKLLPPDAYATRQALMAALAPNERLQQIYRVLEAEGAVKRERDAGGEASPSSRWAPGALLELASSLLLIDDEWLQENFNELFDKVVQRCLYMERYDIYTQPRELTQLAKHLMGNDAGRVYDPFAGVASYALAIPEDAHYIGEEIQPLVAAIGNLRLMANGVEGIEVNESSINDRDFDADIIVSTPPFNLPVEVENFSWGARYGRKNDACSFLMKKCLFGGIRGIIAVAGNFNYSPRLRDCRQMLVDADYIDTIISLPPDIFDKTGVKTCIYVLNPAHSHKGTVRFVDASGLCSRLERKNVMNVGEIISLLETPGEKNAEVALDVIQANKYILAPEYYLKPDVTVPEGATLMRLSELLEYIVPTRSSNEDGLAKGEYLNLNNRDNTNHIQIYRPGHDFEKGLLPMHSQKVSRNCILIPAIMSKWKGIVVQTEGQTVYVPFSWRQFAVKDEQMILPQYLVLQLYQPYFERQVQSSSVNVPDSLLLNASVIVPSIEQQRRELEQYQEGLIGTLGLELTAEKGRKADLLAQEMRIRRHTLLNAMDGIVSGMWVLKSFIDNKNEPFEKTDIVAPRKQMTLEELVNKVNGNLERVVNLITDLTNLGSYGEPEDISIAEFCNEYETRHVGTNDFEIVWPNNRDVAHNLVEEEKLHVSFSRNELYTVFDNIISNACKHGFYGREGESNVIRIEFEPVVNEDMEYVYIRFLNNGNPLHSDINPASVFEWGRKSSRSTGTGVGGWHIKQIVDHYGGEVEISNLENDERGFTMMYEIKLPTATTKI